MASLIFVPANASAAAINVGCNADPAVRVTELIQSINDANASASDDTITLASNCTYSLTALDNATNGGNGLPVILDAASSGALTIQGSASVIERDAAAPNFRLLDVDTGGNLMLDGVTIRGGLVDDLGGGIFNAGTLTVSGSIVSGNTVMGRFGRGGGIFSSSILTVSSSEIRENNAATFQSGGIHSTGAATIISSAISENTARHSGGITNFGEMTATNITVSGNSITGEAGGITNFGTLTLTSSTIENNTTLSGDNRAFGILNGGGTLTVMSSTISGNQGAGIANGNGAGDGGPATITNSTITGNIGVALPGGIFNQGATLTVNNSTISGNSSTGVNGNFNIWMWYGDLILNNSIVANNDGGVECYKSDGNLTITYSLVEDGSCDVVAGTGGNLTGDPNLGALANNGGITQTMALLTGSAAINAGDPAFAPPPDSDQRGAGFIRVADGRVDLGAYEVQPSAPPPTETTGEASPQSSGSVTSVCANGKGSVSGGEVYCHVIARDGQFLANPAEIGIQSILDLGVLQAINLVAMLPNGVTVTRFSAPVGLCLSGTGDVLFVGSDNPNRTIQRLPASISGGQSCVSVPAPGLVVMVNHSSSMAAPAAASPSASALNDCRVTTTDAPLNLRAEPNSSAAILAKLPYALTLTATERVPGWYRVIYLDGQGWVSASFVSTLGDCGS